MPSSDAPARTIYTLLVYNKELWAFAKVFGCKRNTFKGWIEVKFFSNGKRLFHSDGRPLTYTWGSEENPIVLEPNLISLSIELMSRLINQENGFYIKRPSPDTLRMEKNIEIFVSVQTGQNQVIAKGTWGISDMGEFVPLIERVK